MPDRSQPNGVASINDDYTASIAPSSQHPKGTPGPDQHTALPSTKGSDASPSILDLNVPGDAASADSYDALPNTLSPQQQSGTPDPEQFSGLAFPVVEDTAIEIKVGQFRGKDLSDVFDSSPQSYGICSGTRASPFPN